MRILFICGSLAPGQDGVGDYTRQLAARLQICGHEPMLLSLCDQVTSGENTTEEGIRILRCAEALDCHQKQSEIEACVSSWNPDLVSLQFVCFAFHPKGLIRRLIPLMERLRQNCRLHIMFHELWLGEQPDLPIRHKLLGILQKNQILSALRRWVPDCIHTSNWLYLKVLEAENIQPKVLPIFGNIPIQKRPSDEDFRSESKIRKLIFPFSQRHDWDAKGTMLKLQDLALKAGVLFELIQVGRLRGDADHWPFIEEFCKNSGWECCIHGTCSEGEISSLLHSADIGVAAVHPVLLNKSGAAVAILEHGLPVICAITQPVSRRFKHLPELPSGIHSFFESERSLVDLIKNPEKCSPGSRLPEVAAQWQQEVNIRPHGQSKS